MSTVNARVKHVRIDDLDQPLHRIFPVWVFEEVLRLKSLVLVNPSLWIDPREDPCASFVLQPDPKAGFQKHQRGLRDYLTESWAQCWSYERDSDLLLRAYSRVILDPLSQRNSTPKEEGVRVTTTARKLISVMEGWAAIHSHYNFYLSYVAYEPESSFGQSLVNRLGQPQGPRYFSTPDGRAESLSSKRERFRHENEVRLICVGSEKLGTGEKILRLPIDANSLFTEIAFDPRLISFERIERENWFRAKGYSGNIIEDTSYMRTFNLIPMPQEWDDPE